MFSIHDASSVPSLSHRRAAEILVGNGSGVRPRSSPAQATCVAAAALLLLAVACGGSGASGSDSAAPGFNSEVGTYLVAIDDPSEPIEKDDTSPVTGPTFPEPGISCDWFQRTYAHGSLTYPILAPNADVIYPGADLQGMTLIDGIPAPITAPRGGGSIAISNTNGSGVSTKNLTEVSLASVTDGINAILHAQPSAFPADLMISIDRVRTSKEIQILLQANASFFDSIFSTEAGFEFEGSELYSQFLVTLQQNFYSIAFERPPHPGEFYAPGVTKADLAGQVFDGNPASYVSQVTYGRVFYLLIQSTASEDDMKATLSANFFGVAEANGQYHYLTDFDHLKISAYAYGGEQGAALDAVFGGLGTLGNFIQTLKSGNDLLAAKSLSYTVRGIGSDLAYKNAVNADYQYSNCHAVGGCIPVLMSPNSGAVLDNGCVVDANPISWSFSWTPCANADRYQIQVINNALGGTIVDHEATGTSYGSQLSGYFTQQLGWKWRVRAHAYGLWGPWSNERSFTLEAVNTDCFTGVTVYTHPNYAGGSKSFTESVANLETIDGWDDEIDSLKLHNVHGVWLYRDPGYQGGWFYFNHDCPNVQTHSSHLNAFLANDASALKIDP